MSTNPLTFSAFAEWVKQQPPERTYFYPCCKTCALGQYAKSLGLEYTDLPFHLMARGNGVAHLATNFGDLTRLIKESSS